MSELNKPASRKALIITVVTAILGALGVSVAIDDSSPILSGCGAEQSPADAGPAPAGSASSGFAGQLADEDAGVAK